MDQREVPAGRRRPDLTQPCLASVQPCSITARSTACLAAMMAAWPAPSDEPVMTVFDHYVGSRRWRRRTAPSSRCGPGPGEVREQLVEPVLDAVGAVDVDDRSTCPRPLRISVRALIAQSAGADSRCPRRFPQPGTRRSATPRSAPRCGRRGTTCGSRAGPSRCRAPLNSDGRLVGPPVRQEHEPACRPGGPRARATPDGSRACRAWDSVCRGSPGRWPSGPTWNSGSSARAGAAAASASRAHGHACAETALKRHRPTLAAARRLSRRGNP